MKKNVWIALLAASVLTASAMALAGCGGSEEPAPASSAASEASSAASAQEDTPSASQAEESSSEAASSEASSSFSSDFEAVFAENPLDSGFDAQMGTTSATMVEMISVTSTFSDLWSAEITNAYSQLLAEPDTDKAAIEADQQSWNDNLSSELDRIRQSVTSDGSTARLERATLIMEFYKNKAKSLYAQLYAVNPDYTYAYAPY